MGVIKNLLNLSREKLVKKSSFRPDIQGLRAFAVLIVVIYHINSKWLPGGFIGVDVFFVISGYLIIGQILRRIEDKKFNLIEFYAHRIKRLYPAFFVMSVFTTIFAFIFFLPSEFGNYVRSLISSYLYVSNFYFYSKSGYFDSEMQGSPLLHTWSLSVEEQFYLFIPLILVTFSKFFKVKVILPFLFFIGILSFLYSLYLTSVNTNLAFFASYTRFWQFIIGGLVSLLVIKNTLPNKLKALSSALSLMVLVASSFLLKHDDFPGIKALFPTLATAIFLVSSDSGQQVYKLVSNRFSVFLGNISYSLYLWHWPIIIFYIFYNGKSLGKLDSAIVFVLSVLVGCFSYYFVEEKVRKSKVTGNQLFKISFSTSLVFLALAATTSHFNFNRFSDQQIHYESFLNYDDKEYRRDICFLAQRNSDVTWFNRDVCIESAPNKYNIALIGDSHAAHWYSALSKSLASGQTLSQMTASGCKPTVDTMGSIRCVGLINLAYEELLYSESYDRVILSARWKITDLTKLKSSIALLRSRGVDVTVLGPIIEYNVALPRILATHSDPTLALTESSRYLKIKKIDETFKKELAKFEIKYISILDALCESEEQCITSTDTAPLQFDYGHLTESGAQHAVTLFNAF